jgi:hypothetical protein
MRRLASHAALTLLFVAAATAVPACVAAQVSLMAGAGITRPFGDFGDVAESGWQAMAGIQVGVPAIPIALRADGGYQAFGAPAGQPGVSLLGGAASLVVNLPGVGLVPYLLAGVGQYRVSVDQSGVEAVTNNGYHGAFGVNIGALGFGGFAELRLVNIIDTNDAASRFVAVTLGIRM